MNLLLFELLFSFLQIGLFSIGGGYATIPLIADQVVTRHRWLTAQELTDMITISQMTPGPLAVNASTFTGIRIGGLKGAVLATFGCVISGFVISLIMYSFFARNSSSTMVLSILKGLRAASIGLIASTTVTLLLAALSGKTAAFGVINLPFNAAAAFLFLFCLVLLRKFRFSPMLIMALSGAAGIFLYA